ncbi:trypsin-like serine protease [Streptosporangium roseum]|uniref:S1 family peptidase n=1 Tax=Streptosporangium roseum TaxID=2001 RepID=UPI00068C2A5E
MLEALQRDLGLTREQAQTRLLNEARLRPVEAKLRRRLGSRFGGSWFAGSIAQTLVVATTDSADIPQVLAAGARGEVVNRSTTEDIIKTIGVDASAVSVLPSDEQPRPLSDVVGGAPYYVGVTSRCSIGFSVLRGTQNGFVSAGHCGKTGAVTAGVNRVALGVFQASNFPDNDFGWVAVNADWTPKPLVDNGTGGTVAVAGARVAIEGASVCRSGSTTGWHCGTIQQRNASITYPQGTVSEVTRTNVCAEPGDSGGSFISIASISTSRNGTVASGTPSPPPTVRAPTRRSTTPARPATTATACSPQAASAPTSWATSHPDPSRTGLTVDRAPSGHTYGL